MSNVHKIIDSTTEYTFVLVAGKEGVALNSPFGKAIVWDTGKIEYPYSGWPAPVYDTGRTDQEWIKEAKDFAREIVDMYGDQV